jgi:hypothetical protein
MLLIIDKYFYPAEIQTIYDISLDDDDETTKPVTGSARYCYISDARFITRAMLVVHAFHTGAYDD